MVIQDRMNLRLAFYDDLHTIWDILQDAIAQRKKDGSEQWQHGYPNKQIVEEDIQQAHGYVLTKDDQVIAYAAIVFGIEPAYNDIKGQWLSQEDYVVVHRVATAESCKGQGVATQLFLLIEELSLRKGVESIKVDTNFDNEPMLRILEKLHYTFCGEIIFGGAPRMAFEKLLR
jgi:GNAT superfamily N-acetyltransferase